MIVALDTPNAYNDAIAAWERLYGSRPDVYLIAKPECRDKAPSALSSTVNQSGNS